MDALNLPHNYTYENQQGENEIPVYIKEVTDAESALVCLVAIFSVNVPYLGYTTHPVTCDDQPG